MRAPVLAVVMLVACQTGGTLDTYEIPTLTLEITSPTRGQFVGQGDVLVTGRVSAAETVLFVEGERVRADDDGSFSVAVPVDHAYRFIDVTADLYGQHEEARILVWDGTDPRLSWTNGLTVKLTESGLSGLATVLGATLDAALAPDAIAAAFPPIDLGGTTLALTEVTRDPIAVDLVPSSAGITASIGITNLVFVLETSGDVFGVPFSIPATLTFPTIAVDLPVVPSVDPTGALALAFGDPVIGFDPPEVAIGALGFGWLADLIAGAVDLGQLLTDLLAGTLSDLQDLTLGAPLDLEFDLLGTTLALKTNGLVTDASGVALSLGVGLDEPAPSTAGETPYPTGDFADGPADVSVAVHEALLQVLLDSDLLALLDLDLQLPGFVGNIVKTLPGGDQAPDAYGWCIGLDPGDLKLARFTSGEALVAIYLPEAELRFGTFEQGESTCTDWLVASLALEVGVEVTEGTSVNLAIAAPEGKLLAYGANVDDEEAVVAQLGTTLSGLLGLLGGVTSFDLADLLGAGDLLAGLGLPDGTVDLAIRSAQPMTDAAGLPVDGLWEVGLQLFGAPAAP
ncbi:MAG: Glucodextranase, domain [Pseudomonadota bacterium]